nr:gamma-interferon-inducible lysosomal thiol reductase [Helicoverpa armigera]
MLRLIQIVFLFIFAWNQVGVAARQKVLVTVYYESKCPDSRYFVRDQLQPAVNLLHKYIRLKLVPFGKAHSIDRGRNGFKCQHGPSECAGNMVQSCALDLMQERNDVEKVSYVNCEMQTEAGTRNDMRCVVDAGLRPSDVQDCIRSRGRSLQLEAEYLTNQIRPRFIPTTTLNGVFKQIDQDSSLRDLTATLCTVIREGPCAHYHSMLRYILL